MQPCGNPIRQVDVPAGKSGDWQVSHFTVRNAAAALFNIREGYGFGRYVKPGTYTYLTRCRQVIMSDTPAELDDHRELMRYACKGHVLINDLGLGVVVQAVMDKPGVEHLTVIEKSVDVITLVGPHWRVRYGDRLTIIRADALKWTPPEKRRYQAVWHDIWDDIGPDNLKTMRRLYRKYKSRCEWQGSWCQRECEMMHRWKTYRV